MSDQTQSQQVQPEPKTQAVQIRESKDKLESKILSGGFLEELNKVAVQGADVRLLCNQLIREAMKDPKKMVEVVSTPKGMMSIIDCAVRAARIGFQFDGQQAYPVPFKDKGVMTYKFIPGYKGWIAAMASQGEVASVDAQLVYANDKFKLDLMNPEKCMHQPAMHDRGEVVFGYMIARMVKGGAPIIYAMDRKKLDEAVIGTSDAWLRHPEPMWIATLFRRGHNKVPMTPGSQLSVLSKISSEVDQGVGTDLSRTAVLGTSPIDSVQSNVIDADQMPE